MVLSAGNPWPMMKLRPVAPQCFLPAADTHANMQPHHTSSLKGTPVSTKTGTPSRAVVTAADRITVKPIPVLRQSGDRADYLTQELDMETTFITTTSTELYTLDNKMIDLGQEVCSAFSSAEDSVHQGPPAGTSKTAIFDVQSDPLVDSGRGLFPFKHNEGLYMPPCVSSMVDSVFSSERPTLSMPPCVSGMVDSVFSSERPTLSMPPCVSGMVDSGLSSERSTLSMHPCVSGMVDSILSSERPISPSEFLQKNPAPPSQPQMEDLEIPPDLLKEIDDLLAENSEDITRDSIQQLDLNLFSQFEEPDALDSIVQECGILEEMKEESHFKHEGDTPNSTLSATMTQPHRIQSNHVGPVRTRRTRRPCRKPARYRETPSLDDTEVTVMAELEDVIASTSGTTPTRRKGSEGEELSNEEKYIRSRIQNNMASKRCRERRKGKLEKMEMERAELERKNKVLQDKVAQLSLLRDNFKDFVNKFLFQQIAQK